MRGADLLLEPAAVAALVASLQSAGWTTLGPRRHDGVVSWGALAGVDDLPVGWHDEQAPGRYRLSRRDDGAWFGTTVGPLSPKTWLFPPRSTVCRVRRGTDGLAVEAPRATRRRLAFVGARPCEVAAMAVLRAAVVDGPVAARRLGAGDAASTWPDTFVVAVACRAPAATCWCASLGTGPGLPGGEAGPGPYDIGMVELCEGGHRFVAHAASAQGAEVLAGLASVPAPDADVEAATSQARDAAATQVRHLPPVEVVSAALLGAPDHPAWAAVAERCLACGACTQSCPTCACFDLEDSSDLAGTEATRTRRWDSCFTTSFSRLHAGSVRTSVAARYRQWLTHKLATWPAQYGTSGCVGCGRCTTWCPAGIDLPAVVAGIVGAPTGTRGGEEP